jgi:hypothetical protein
MSGDESVESGNALDTFGESAPTEPLPVSSSTNTS